MKIIENIYTISAMAWKPDGSRLTIVGVIKIIDIIINRNIIIIIIKIIIIIILITFEIFNYTKLNRVLYVVQ